MPDTGSERPGGMTSDTREMTELSEADTRAALGAGPRGSVVLLCSALIVIAVVIWLLVR